MDTHNLDNQTCSTITVEVRNTTSNLNCSHSQSDVCGIQRIRRITRTYVAYCGLVRELNDCDNMLMLAQLFRLVMHLAGHLVAFLLFLSSIPPDLDLNARIYSICYDSAGMLFYGSLMVLLVEPSHRAEIQVLEKNAFEEFNELQILLQQLHLNKPVYTAFSVCTLQRPLITTILSGIATFLVISLQ
ncbi:unnamed protein product [Leptosia nina]|uniref:Uncharacterized protein n=1 Tax=Leptosia nina TaxID=320188 RepID=A0AAV1IWW6_9NEOP